jgi:hypothetical protein
MEDIKKILDKVRYFDENLNIKIKDGVDSLFKEYPELSNIGTE